MSRNHVLTFACLMMATALLGACNTMPNDHMKTPAQPDQNPAHQMHYSH